MSIKVGIRKETTFVLKADLQGCDALAIRLLYVGTSTDKFGDYVFISCADYKFYQR